MKDRVVEAMVINFCRGDECLTTMEFVTRCALFPQYFDTLGVRDETKKEIQLIEELTEGI